MLEVCERLGTEASCAIDARIILTHEQRDRGRLRAFSPEGEEVRIFLSRGTPLQVGEFLRCRCGRHVLVEGAIEPVAIARCDDWLLFAKACYHLGNRHVKLQVSELSLSIQRDHVLEDMLTQLGLKVEHGHDVFIPESGAYFQNQPHSHAHHHSHGHAHEHSHEHHHDKEDSHAEQAAITIGEAGDRTRHNHH
ncbi:MAG TPA: urease accessory protein UreE [Pseudohongiella sp.]|uniref:urease accessory protein UreE n=1 Tax=Pseudohongiella sp. O18 TaxID=2904248 RepID=UPI000C8C840B|nr:urease accessory protein UreE [Pseudohongiella sp. O18]MAO39831.1 urease accessory protein UreE [Pseudohongiella sp.]HBX38145.1 urease accessory protein UreE [Pseudohongiella sp.]